MLKTINHPQWGDVVLSQSRRARRVLISVRGSGVVRLSYPYGVSQARALEFLESKAEWVTAARVRMLERRAALPPCSMEDQKVQIEELRRAAKLDLLDRTERLAKALGLHYGRVTIRASRTKWGSCTGGNNLSLSLFLMVLPEHLRDYVIVHELCHTVHHDHSPRFHALVDSCLGGQEKTLGRELKGYTTCR